MRIRIEMANTSIQRSVAESFSDRPKAIIPHDYFQAIFVLSYIASKLLPRTLHLP